MSTCSKCLLPGNYPSISFDAEGVCNFCRNPAVELSGNIHLCEDDKRQKYRKDLEQTLRSTRGSGDYDVMIALSGGKDSTYILNKIKTEYDLRIIGISVDTGFLNPIAIENIKEITEKVDIDHMFIRPQNRFFKKLYSHFFTHKFGKDFVHSICYACGCVIEAIVIKHAIQMRIPLVLQGYAPWQPENIFYEMPRDEIISRDYFIPTHKKEMLEGPFSPSELCSVLPPIDIASRDVVPRVLCPLHVWDYNVDEIRLTLQKKNLIPKNKSSALKTNCLLNYPLIYLDYNIDGYNPYLFELCCLIREGRVRRADWKKQVAFGNFLSRNHILVLPILKDIERRLGIRFDEILAKYKNQPSAVSSKGRIISGI